MKRIQNLIFVSAPLFLLLSCSPTRINPLDALNRLEVIEYHQKEQTFSLPTKATITIKNIINNDFINVNQPSFYSKDEIIILSYNSDNNFFYLSKIDNNDSTTLEEHFYYIDGMNFYTVNHTNTQKSYHMNNKLTYDEMKERLYEIVNDSGFFDLLLGKRTVDDFYPLFVLANEGVESYQKTFANNTQVDRFNFYFYSENENSLEANAEIQTSLINKDNISETLFKTYLNRQISFKNNILVNDFLVNEHYFRFRFNDDNTIRYEDVKEVYSIEVSLFSSYKAPNLDTYNFEYE